MDIKKIRFLQSGGFAGLVRACEVPGEDLAPDHRKALERLARATAAGPAAESSAVRDALAYKIEIETDAGAKRLEFDETNVPEELAALVEELAAKARPVPL